MKRRHFIFAAFISCCAAQMGNCQAADGVSDVRLVPAWPTLSSFAPTDRLYLNWSDLPFVLNANQSIAYNNNILGSAQNTGTGNIYGDLYEATNFGASIRHDYGPQEFFADANYGFTHYKTYSQFDTSNYLLDAGLRFQLTSRCSGSLRAVNTQSQSALDELISPGINTVNSKVANETLSCNIYSGISTSFDSGYNTSQNSQVISALSDNTSYYFRGGVQYAASGIDSIMFSTQYTHRTFGGSASAATLGFGSTLANSTTEQVDYTLTYQRTFSPKLNATVTGGLTQLSTQGVSGTQTLPTYSINLSYNVTPKVTVSVVAGHSAGAPVSVLATTQVSDTQSVVLSYAFSPKLSFQANFSHQESTGSGSLSASVINGIFAISNTSTSEGGSASYQISPFLSATASVRHIARTYNTNLDATTNLYTLGISYSPR